MEDQLFTVELNRVHKSSPFNCSGFIPELKCNDISDVPNHPDVIEMINQTYGKHFILMVSSSVEYLEVDIIKQKAIQKLN